MEHLDRMRQDVESSPGGTATDDVIELGQEMLTLKEEIDTLDERKKDAQARYDEIRKRLLPDAMEAAGLVDDSGKGSFSLSDGSKIHLRSALYANVRAADRERLHEWLRAHGYSDLIRETVHTGTLKAWAKEQRENGEDLPEFVSVHDETVATLRRGK